MKLQNCGLVFLLRMIGLFLITKKVTVQKITDDGADIHNLICADLCRSGC